MKTLKRKLLVLIIVVALAIPISMVVVNVYSPITDEAVEEAEKGTPCEIAYAGGYEDGVREARRDVTSAGGYNNGVSYYGELKCPFGEGYGGGWTDGYDDEYRIVSVTTDRYDCGYVDGENEGYRDGYDAGCKDSWLDNYNREGKVDSLIMPHLVGATSDYNVGWIDGYYEGAQEGYDYSYNLSVCQKKEL